MPCISITWHNKGMMRCYCVKRWNIDMEETKFSNFRCPVSFLDEIDERVKGGNIGIDLHLLTKLY